MFRAIQAKDIIKVLDANPEKYFDEREELEDLMDEEDTSFYASDDCILVFSPRRLKTQVLAIPLKEDFDLAAMERFVHTKCEQFQIHLNVSDVESGSLRFTEPYEVSEPVHSLWTEDISDRNPELEGVIRILDDKDSRHANHFKETDDFPGMGLKQSFPFLVMDEVGQILGYFSRDGELLGYISFMPTELEAYSVDGIYVSPKMRRRGIGTALAQEMIRLAKEAGVSAYWPVAQDEVTEKTAKAAGFKRAASRITIETF